MPSVAVMQDTSRAHTVCCFSRTNQFVAADEARDQPELLEEFDSKAGVGGWTIPARAWFNRICGVVSLEGDLSARGAIADQSHPALISWSLLHETSWAPGSMPAILPLLPSVWGLLSCLTFLAGPLFWWVGRRQNRRLGLAFVRSQWRGLLVLAGMGVGVYVAGSAVFAVRRESSAERPAPSWSLTHDWPLARGSLQRTGSDSSRGPRRGGVNWVRRSTHAFYGSPAVSGEYVVAVGTQGRRGRCWAWHVPSGEEVWSGGPADYRETYSSPVLYQGLIYCGEGLHHTSRARVLCWDPTQTGERSVLWSWTTASHVECTPVCVEGRIYIAAGDDGVYCFHADPALPPAQRLCWHVPGEQLPDAETALAVHQGRVYVGLGFGGTAVVMLDALTGRELGRVALPHPVFTPPAWFAEGWLIGMGPGHLLSAATAGAGEIRCLDPQTLHTRWSLTVSASVLSAPAIRGHEAVCTVADGHLLVLDGLGQIVRSWRSPAPILAAAAVSDDMLYVVAQDGLLTGLDAESLAPVWQVRLGAPGLYVSAPVIVQGRLVVGTPEGLMCVGSPEGAATEIPEFVAAGVTP